MDVGINLRDLRARGQLSAAARSLGVNEHEAIGILADAWAETQDRELSVCTADSFAEAVSLRFDDPSKVFEAMKRAQLIVPFERTDDPSALTQEWLIKGNEKHVLKLQAFRENAKKGAAAAAAKRDLPGKRLGPSRVQAGSKLGTQELSTSEPKSFQPQEAFGSQSRSLVTGILDTGIKDPNPDLTSPVLTPISESRSSVSSESQSELALTAPPSAAAVAALRALDPPPPKRKERSPEQKQRSVANARLYRELYAAAEGHEPTGLDQAFYGAMAKFSDKHAEGAEHILRWVFTRCPDKSFRAKGWPLPLIIEQAPRLWRELNDPLKAVENVAAPRIAQRQALSAANDLAFVEFLQRHGEVPNAR